VDRMGGKRGGYRDVKKFCGGGGGDLRLSPAGLRPSDGLGKWQCRAGCNSLLGSNLGSIYLVWSACTWGRADRSGQG
jgi:hypothetical protein